MKLLISLLLFLPPGLLLADPTSSPTNQQIQLLLLRAKTNDADAEFELGKCYHEGLGVKKDSAESLRWYEKAAEHGIVEAQMMVGVSYWTGLEVKADEEKGVKWFEKAAEEGEPGAFFYLGASYYLGKGVQQDYLKSYIWTLVFKASGQTTIPKDTADVDFKIKDLEQKLSAKQIAEGRKRAREVVAKLSKKPRFLKVD